MKHKDNGETKSSNRADLGHFARCAVGNDLRPSRRRHLGDGAEAEWDASGLRPADGDRNPGILPLITGGM